MKYVGIWECESGDWYGIEPDSELEKNNPELFLRLKNGYVIPRPDEGGSFLFWNEMHKYLSYCGFDFVKVDTQCNIEGCTSGAYPIGEAANGIHSGLEGSVGLYFDGACINCTGMGHADLWSRSVGMINRNSEDFVATDINTMSKFINENIYNSFYHSHFCAADWDMMWSKSETTELNVVLHAVSGSPVYFSDPLGMSDKDVIMPFCLLNGRLLKCDGYANPTRDRLFLNPMTQDILSKCFNFSKDSAVIALFNTNQSKKKIKDSFKISDADGIEGESFVLYDRKTKTAVLSKKEEEHKLTLDPDTARLYIATPFKDGIAALGAVDKYVCPAIIEDRIIAKNTQSFVLSEGCIFAFSADCPVSVTVNGAPAETEKDGVLLKVDCRAGAGRVIVSITQK